jgi:3-hydroxy-3-methylglutaryl CoA synthase/uncharacterized OB-fold protein
VSILACGAFIPWTRVARGKAERAVAGSDEDSVTMAVAAAADCLRGVDRAAVTALLFASTTAPYAEKQAAALVARALDLRPEIRTVDFGGSLRAGMSALAAALDLARGDGNARVLVIASDCRRAAPGSPIEPQLGDAAVAFLIGDGGFATVEAHHALAEEILDTWRRDGAQAIERWEERFVTEQNRHTLTQVVAGLCARIGHAPGDFDRLVLDGPDARAHADAVRALKVAPERAQAPLYDSIGHAGAAFALLGLAAALEDARAGERILCAAVGDGAEAIALRVSTRQDGSGLAHKLLRRRVVPRPIAALPPVAGGISATVHHRDRDSDLALCAQSCRRCGTLQFPTQRVCCHCYAKDEFVRVRLSDRRGKLVTYTLDWFHPSAEPPTIAGVVEIEGGCRLYLMMADAKPEEARCDLPVELVFRKAHDAGGKPNYFWKCTPIRSDA